MKLCRNELQRNKNTQERNNLKGSVESICSKLDNMPWNALNTYGERTSDGSYNENVFRLEDIMPCKLSKVESISSN